MVKLLKDYYASRRAALIGALTLPVGLAMLTAMFVVGFPEHLIVIALIGLGLTIYGASVGIWGISHWIDSTSEMKALDVAAPARLRPNPSTAAAATSRIPSLPVPDAQFSTDPIEPGSVTEQTTRQLEQSRPHLENGSSSAQ